ncbi:MAG: anti-CBASS protein Acb1 family protein [Planctomycetota bacterium]|jgi:phage-related protein (TIGR01555 family)
MNEGKTTTGPKPVPKSGTPVPSKAPIPSMWNKDGSLNRKGFEGLNLDGWVNVLAGLGGFEDKTGKTTFGSGQILVDDELSRMWLGEGLGKKIVSCVADDMTRKWIDIPEDEDGEIQANLVKISAETEVNLAIKWARLYRGCLVVVGVNDGQKLWKPLNPKRIKSVDWMKVYPAPRVLITPQDIVKDPNSKFFEDVEKFRVIKLDGGEFTVHRTRCLVFKGDPVPNATQNVVFQNLYWGVSVLQSIFTQLKNYGSIEQSMTNLMMELIIGKYTLSNLAEILSQNNTEAFYKRMMIINACKSILNGVMLGEGEKYERDTANLAGVPEVIDRFQVALSAVTEIPVTRLWGRSPAGENSTGKSDMSTYYDMVIWSS